MKLSEAMMLGSTMCKMEPGNWDLCAIGVAHKAVGSYFNSATPEFPWLKDTVPGPILREENVYYSEHCGYLRAYGLITQRFDKMVCRGLMTFEQLVDYVRSIEPDCSICNEFTCKCVQKMDSVLDNVPAYSRA